MSRKKRRRSPGRQIEQSTSQQSAAPDAASPLSADDAVKAERRAQQIRDWEKRKREKTRAKRSIAPFFWGAGILVTIAAVALAVVLLIGGGDDDGAAAPSATPDRRIAGLPIDETVTVEADDDGQATNPRFIPSTITAEAGRVVEIIVPNVGSVAHNLRLAGLDGEYDTRDDWITDPATIFEGDEGRVVVKIDEPGTYPFRCDFHPQQIGTLTLR
ncbi:MAG: cupredoxin domain-containing protein [Dehalococcoidia bacterium]